MMKLKDPKALLIAALLASFALSSCGIKGDLSRPAPVWGEDVPESEKPAETPEDEELYDDDLDPDIDY